MSPRAPLTDAERAAITSEALRIGDLRPIMTRTQRLAYRQWRAKRHPLFFLDCSRRWGKTFFLVMLVVECALKTRNGIIRYCAPTKLHGRTFVMPAMKRICEQLPESMRPKFNAQDNSWTFPTTGAVCHLGSAETIADCDAQVGTECHLAVFDEAAKVRSDVLKYLHKTVIIHQFLTTHGVLVIGTTPPVSPAHYLTDLRARATESGACVRFTIDDCDHISAEMKAEAIDECGGPNTPEAKRELYCEHIPDRDWLVVPEWLDVAATSVIDITHPPNYRDWYASGDFGFEDLTVVLYAWFDFLEQRIVVEHEVVGHRVSSLDVGKRCKDLELAERITPVARVADAPLQLLADMSDTVMGPGINFGPAMKDDADASLAQLRNEIQRGKVIVNPRCTTLLSHLKGAIWNTNRSGFERMGGEYGHWDAIDALKYLNRAVSRRRNPVPVLGKPGQNTFARSHPVATQKQRYTLGRAS